MAKCLIALGSNLGDRDALLRTALQEIDSLANVRVVRASRLATFAPVGGPAGQDSFRNAAVVVETRLSPNELFERLLDIETRHGRQRAERWIARTLDLDLLLYDEQTLDTGSLVLPHPRMSFRPFVLQPAAEIAAEMLHPTIGWSVGQLCDHLNTPNDRLAIVSHSNALRTDLCQALFAGYGARVTQPPDFQANSADRTLWPPENTAWVSMTPVSNEATAANVASIAQPQLPKLTILLDSESTDSKNCLLLPGRGPTLHLRASAPVDINDEVAAALSCVWPDLCRTDAKGVQ